MQLVQGMQKLTTSLNYEIMWLLTTVSLREQLYNFLQDSQYVMSEKTERIQEA